MNYFFEKLNKIDTLLAKLRKKKRTYKNKIRNEREDVTTILTEIDEIIRCSEPYKPTQWTF